jgi:hypothetical protein
MGNHIIFERRFSDETIMDIGNDLLFRFEP